MSRELYFSSVHDRNKVKNNKTACSLEDVTGIDLRECVFIQTGKRGNNTMRGVGTVRVPHTMVCQCPTAFGNIQKRLNLLSLEAKYVFSLIRGIYTSSSMPRSLKASPPTFWTTPTTLDSIYILMSSHITLFERSLRFRKGYSDLYNHERFERQFKRKVWRIHRDNQT